MNAGTTTLVLLTSVVAAVVVDPTAASAHANVVNGVVSCSAVGSTETITWTVANDYDLSEDGSVVSATPGGAGSVSGSPFSIPASPSTPYQSVTLIQTLPGTDTGTDTLTVSGTWSDDYQTDNSGSVTLPSGGCVPPAPTLTTAPGHGSVVLGNTDTDSATVTGVGTVTPTGTITFYVCGPFSSPTACTKSGTDLGTLALTGSGGVAAVTGPAYTPPATGTYCFFDVYASGDGNYSGTSDGSTATECFTVTKATPGFTTTPSNPSGFALGGSTSDSATVTGVNSTAPTGTVSFVICKETTVGTPCTGGTAVGSLTSPTSTSGAVSTYTLAAGVFTPTSTGTYCFNASYGGDSNYAAVTSESNTAAECFTVTLATPGFTTTPSNPSGFALGGSTSDSATVTGVNSTAPTGTVSFVICKETTVGTPCTGGTAVGSLTSPTSTSGAVSTYTLAAGVFTPTSTGTYCFNASYGGDSNYAAVTSESNTAAECFTVTAPPPGVSTAPGHATIVLGNTNSDTATVTGVAGVTPTGTVHFYVCGPFASVTTCTTAGTDLGTVSLTGSAGVATATSPAYTPLATGTYCFLGVYSGDGNYQGGSDGSTTRECFTVTAPPPGVSTAPGHATIVLGNTNSDTATVTGVAGVTPTGTVHFYVCGPFASVTTCTTAGTDLGTVSLTGSAGVATATSPAYTPLATGTYCFLGVYSGDGNYQGGSDGSTTRECFTVTAPPPGVSTAPGHATIVLGNTNSDTATVTGVAGVTPTGTVHFYVCGPFASVTTCTTAGTDLGTVSLTGSAGVATATSPAYTPLATGTYCFLGVYSGDGNYQGGSDGSTTRECFTVTAPPPGVSTAPGHATIVLGNTNSDTATVTGVAGVTPTGTVHFYVCGPFASVTTCTTAGTDLGTVSLTGSAGVATATSPAYTPLATGTYCFLGVYSGDGNYQGGSDGSTTRECFTVTAPPPGVSTAPGHATIVLGNTNSDTATVTGVAGVTPTGTVHFYVCGPFASVTTCTTAGTDLGTVSLTGSAGVATATSPAYTPLATGTYCFLGVYSGDGNYQGGSDGSTTRECFTVTAPPPGVSTAPGHATIVLGNTNSDTATVTGVAGVTPTGTVHFYVCGPFASVTTCTTAGTDLGTVSLTGSAGVATATSPAYTPLATGTYCFLGVYSGDGNYQGGSDGSTTRECFTVTAPPPGVSTAPGHATIVLGNTNSDTATVTGVAGVTPTGTVHFYVCGPFASVTTCTTAGTDLGTVSLTGSAGVATATSPAYTPLATGTYCFLGVYSGDGNYQGGSDGSTTRECFTVTAPPPGVSTAPGHATIVLGNTNSDTATVTGVAGVTPTGTVHFYVCGPFASVTTCTTAGTDLGTVSLTGSAGVATATSPAYTPLATGTYCFLGVYSGDGNYQGGSDGSTTRECFTVTAPPPGVSTAPGHATIVLGNTNSDTATVTGVAGVTPTGTVHFYVCGPFASVTTCTTAGTDLGTVSLTGSAGVATATSPAYTPLATGTYCFLGVYSGDGNYQGGSDGSTTRECFTVTAPPPGVSTAPGHATIVLGNTNSDTATVTGVAGVTPTGTVHFYVCGPFASVTTCTTAGTDLGTVSLTGSAGVATATSPAYTPLATGTYCFLGVYSGDGNYQGGSDGSTTRECFTVTAPPPGVSTAPGHATIVLGNTNSDTATVTGVAGVTPTGTVHFYVCGPFASVTTCTTAGTDLGTVSLTGSAGVATATSPAYTPLATGTYCFLGVYSGDGNYQGGSDGSTTRECFTVTAPPPGVSTAPGHATIVLGNTNSDTATVTGVAGVTPTGTVHFYVCGPFASVTTCTTAGTDLGTVSLTGSAGVATATSPAYTPLATGTYCFLGVYSGDGNYQGGSDGSTTRECFTVTAPPPGVSTAPGHATIVLGNTNSDTATVTGVAGVTPTGTVHFYVCGPFASVTTCTTAGTDLGTVSLTGSAGVATATSPAYTPLATGTYCFLGVYSGDGNYQGGSDGSTTRECFTVTAPPPGVSTAPGHATIVLGNTNSDTATVTGVAGVTPTGTVHFYVCGPFASVTTCTTAGTDLGTVSLTGSAGVATATSPAYTPLATGTYCFLGVYSGDGNYQGGSDGSTTRECFTVTKATPGFTTTPSNPSGFALGGSTSDSATVTGVNSTAPTGTVSFVICKETTVGTPCTGGTAVGSLTSPTSTSGAVSTYTLAAGVFTPTSTGTYCFNASYGGDSNYAAVTSESNTAAECFTVTLATPGFTTTPSNPSGFALGGSTSDSATVTGVNSTAPTGTVSFVICKETTVGTPCTGGTAVGSLTSPTSTSGAVSTYTLAAGVFTPTSTGTYCFNASYGGDSNYAAVTSESNTAAECFTVTLATPGFTTTPSNPSGFALGGSTSDSATVTGVNSTAPTGTVSFVICKETTVGTPCTGGTAVGSLTSPTSTSGAVSTYTLAAGVFTPTSTGTYCFNASYGGDSNYAAVTSESNTAAECFTVTAPPPGVSTAPGHATIVLGNTNSDTATVTGVAGVTPTGTVHFYVCGPFASVTTCTTAGTDLGTVSLTGSAGVATATSPAYTPLATGTYCFLGVYSGDGNYQGGSDGSTTRECFTVTAPPPGVSTAPGHATIVLGNTNSDTATVTGVAGVTPTGTVHFYVCGPFASVTTCTTAGTDLGTVSLTGSAGVATATSPAYTPLATGTYCFLGVYSGDGNYQGGSDGSTTRECFTVTAPPPGVSTAPGHATIVLGNTNSDTATVTGVAGVTPTGTVHFYVCGPFASVTTCTTAGTDLGTVSLTGSAGVATATSPAYTPLATGTYCFLGVYSGDGNYQGGSDGSTTRECFTVTAPPPGVSTAPGHATIVLGNTNSDTATVTGVAGVTPTGTVHFYVCGPFASVTTCTTAGTDLGTVSLTGSAGVATATSPAYTPLATGTYCFLGVYSGDGNYQGGSDGSTTRECFTVTAPPPGVSTAPGHATIVLGNTNSDTATVTGVAGVTPTGTVHFYVCGPFASVTTCTTAGTDLGTVSLTGSAGVATATSPAYTPLATGTYCFLGVYSGDGNYQGGSDGSTTRECFTVTAPPPGVSTAPGHATIVLGNTNSDTATVTGVAGVTPTGTVHFYVCGPFASVTTCTTAGTDLGTVSLTGSAGVATATSPAYTPLATGTYCFLGVYSGDGNYQGGSDGSTTRECFTVTAPPPGVSTAPGHATIVLGNTNSDTATVTGVAGVTPTGTVHFYVCGPFASVTTCTTAGTDLGTVSLTGSAGVATATSPAYTPLATGTYCFLGVYSGDGNYQGGSDGSTTRECFTVTMAPSGVVTTPGSGSGVLGATNSDTATVTGVAGVTPTGTVHFYVCGPFASVTTCTTAGTDLGTVSLTGSAGVATATSPPFMPLAGGTYCFLGVYSGDANYQGGSDGSTTRECFTITVPPVVVITAPGSASVALGNTNSDTATVTGLVGFTPTGTVTFYVCGPFASTTACSTSGTDLGTVALTGSAGVATATSPAFTPLATGTYCFLGVYSGDANYAGGSDGSTTRECFTVAAPPPGVSTAPGLGSVVLGNSDSDTATVTGVAGITPTGTVTFYICAGNANPCTPTTTGVIDLGTVALTGSAGVATATSPAFTPLATGTYCFLGVYSGDGNYQGGSDGSTTRECFTDTPADPGVSTTPGHPSIVFGNSNTDKATVTGVAGVTPTGSVHFYVCGPFASVTTCTTSGTDLGSVAVSGSGITATATSPAYTPLATGTYCFLGVYSGDSNYLGGSDGSTIRECFVVTQAPPGISTAPSNGSIVFGNSNTDMATVTGVGNVTPTGTVHFYVCKGSNPCTTAGTDLGSVTLTGSAGVATATSASFTPGATGTYCFLGVYSGDANYAGGSDGSTARECFVVTMAPSSVMTTPAASSIKLGHTNTDTVIVTGNAGGSPTGTVTFYVCGPTKTAVPCTSTKKKLKKPVTLTPGPNDTATATSVPFKPKTVGVWCFAGYYSGNANYHSGSDTSVEECFAVVPPCGLAVTVSPNPLVETGQSDVEAIVQVQACAVYAGDTVNIDSSQLQASCSTLTFTNLQGGGTPGAPQVTKNNIQAVLDDDGNADVVMSGTDCAPGPSVVEVDLAVAPFLTALTTLQADPPVTTPVGVSGTPNPEVETGDTTASGISDVYTVFYVETDPVYAGDTVEIDSPQLLARCVEGDDWISNQGSFPGATATATLDNDGNAVFVFIGASCASGPSAVIADVDGGNHPTYTATYTMVPPTPNT